MSSHTPNTPGYPGGYSSYPPQPDQGYGTPSSPSYGRQQPPSFGELQAPNYADGQRPAYDPSRRLAPYDRGQPPRSRRGLLIGLAVAVIVPLLLLGGGGLLIAYQTAQAAKPLEAANAYCQDLKTQNYAAAYTMLASSYKSGISQTQFAQASQLRDQLDGKVKDCAAQKTIGSGFSLDVNPTSANLSAQVTRNKTFSGSLALVKEGDAWKVSRIDDLLQGTDIGPLAVGQHFCSSLVARNYAAAYGDFSARRKQAIGSQTDYVNAMKKNFGGSGVSVSGCKTRLDTYSVAPADDSASVTMELDVKVSTQAGTQTQPIPLKITFAKNGGAWKIDDAQVAG
jgi:hypothetical protein